MTGSTIQAGPGVTLARFLSDLSYEDIPPDVVATAKLCVLDTLGVGLTASRRPWTRMVVGMAREAGGTPVSAVWGHGFRTSPQLAALANGTAAHGIEMDDRIPTAELHPGSMVVPAALAVAEAARMAGRELLAAVVAGYEAGIRVGYAVRTRPGIHSPGHKGVWATVAAAGRALGLDAQGMQDAFGLAGSMASGITEFSQDSRGTMVKRLHGGLAAQHGVLAAQLAGRGVTGPASVLDGIYGYCRVFGADVDEIDLDELTVELGRAWRITDRELKPYAAWGGSHTVIDAIGKILAESAPRPGDVAAVEVAGSSRLLVQHDLARPRSIMAAQYSLPFLTATALCRGADALTSPDEVWTEDLLDDPDILRLAALVELRVDAEMDEIFRRERTYGGARVRVRLRDGSERAAVVYHSRGTTKNPMSREEIHAKFTRLAGGVLGERRARELLTTVDDLEHLVDVGELTDLVS
ncbi:MmgE/PrpD family protein [Actinophytocola sp.]|uniref:MmgE/PrpD family protein n=1 Tax=Actinophytocola sp. TaxID=1872138 RepID=UPI003D6B834D